MIVKEPIAFSCDNEKEVLTASCVEDAAIEYLDDIPESEWPETVEVFGFAHVGITDTSFDLCLENLLEALYDNYGSGDDMEEYTFSEEALSHFSAFKSQVISEYPKWQCERVGDPIIVTTAQFKDEAREATSNE